MPEKESKILRMRVDDIARIGDVNRRETIAAEYLGKRSPDGKSFEVRIRQKPLPERVPEWGQHGTKRRIQAWKPRLEQGGAMFGAFIEGWMVGFAIVGPREADASAELVALLVDRDHRRSGIGSNLLLEAETHASEHEVQSIFVRSSNSVSSVEFFLNWGYEIVDIVEKRISKTMRCDVMLAKKLEKD